MLRHKKIICIRICRYEENIWIRSHDLPKGAISCVRH